MTKLTNFFSKQIPLLPSPILRSPGKERLSDLPLRCLSTPFAPEWEKEEDSGSFVELKFGLFLFCLPETAISAPLVSGTSQAEDQILI